jgi:hypothetical protein
MKKILVLLLSILIISCNSTEEKIYCESDLQKLTLSELRIKRNEIFAKHGYIFKSQDLTDHFSKFDWYKPTSHNVDDLLTETDKENINLIVQIEKEVKKHLIETDFKTIKNYKKLENSTNDEFIERIIRTISKFKDRKADTTILQICNIDNLGELDTIKNRIYYLNENVFVNSSWSKNGQLVWENEVKNPYLWIDDSDEFQFDTREPWVTFTIGIYYAIPEIKNINYYSHIDKNIVLKIGIDWGKRENKSISKDEYSDYLDSFKGDLIAYGHPEKRDGLIIWYEPINDFVLYYTP